MDSWTEEEWRRWAADALASGSIWILEKGERVTPSPPSTPEQKATFLALMQTLRDKHGVKTDG